MSFVESPFAQFMSSAAGRITRIVAGIVLIVWGYLISEQTIGIVLMIVGLMPLATGLFDLCIMTALFGGPLSGSAVRQAAKKRP